MNAKAHVYLTLDAVGRKQIKDTHLQFNVTLAVIFRLDQGMIDGTGAYPQLPRNRRLAFAGFLYSFGGLLPKLSRR